MSLKPVNLTCPKCGKQYSNYSEYFKCWTTHIESITLNAPIDKAKTIISERDEAINYYSKNPDEIEQGLKIIKDKVTVFNGGQIDLYAVDRNGKLVFIDVSGRFWRTKAHQLTQMRKEISLTLPKLLGLNLPEIRIIMIKFHKYMKEC